MNDNAPLPVGTPVNFNIARMHRGAGRITAAEYDYGWLYRIDVTSGDPEASMHRNADGELWVCDFEVTPCRS